MKVAIIGATGYGGAVLVRILRKHPHVSIHYVHASSMYSEPYSVSLSQRQTLRDDQLLTVHINKISKQVDLESMATPSRVAMKLAPQLLQKGVKVIDLSCDYRITGQEVYQSLNGIVP